MLISRSTLQPLMRKTPMGGTKLSARAWQRLDLVQHRVELKTYR